MVASSLGGMTDRWNLHFIEVLYEYNPSEGERIQRNVTCNIVPVLHVSVGFIFPVNAGRFLPHCRKHWTEHINPETLKNDDWIITDLALPFVYLLLFPGKDSLKKSSTYHTNLPDKGIHARRTIAFLCNFIYSNTIQHIWNLIFLKGRKETCYQRHTFMPLVWV